MGLAAMKWLTLGLSLALSDALCEDHNPHCNEWAQEGECGRNSGFMHQSCRRSCEMCPPPSQQMLGDLDADQDGKLTKEEIIHRLKRVSAVRKEQRMQDQSQSDEANEIEAKQAMSDPEFSIRSAPEFTEHDADGDGFVTLTEIIARVEQTFTGVADPLPDNWDWRKDLEMTKRFEQARVQKSDLDADGMLSKAEFA